MTRTLTQPAPQLGFLVQIQPEALIFLQDREVADHVMATLQAFQQWHPQILNATPARLQAATIMPIPRELLGIRASTLPTHPVNRSRADPSEWLSLLFFFTLPL